MLNKNNGEKDVENMVPLKYLIILGKDLNSH